MIRQGANEKGRTVTGDRAKVQSEENKTGIRDFKSAEKFAPLNKRTVFQELFASGSFAWQWTQAARWRRWRRTFKVNERFRYTNRLEGITLRQASVLERKREREQTEERLHDGGRQLLKGTIITPISGALILPIARVLPGGWGRNGCLGR